MAAQEDDGEHPPTEQGGDTDDGAAVAGEHGEARENGSADVRRRRRGRRGGRRNRRGRDGEPILGEANGEAGGEHHAEQPREYAGDQPAAESYQPPQRPDDTSPHEMRAFASPPSEQAARPEPRPEASMPPAMSAPAMPAESEQPKRRSTIREPAPIFGVSPPASSSPPAPIETPLPASAPAEAAESEAEKPKRGWWRRG